MLAEMCDKMREKATTKFEAVEASTGLKAEAKGEKYFLFLLSILLAVVSVAVQVTLENVLQLKF